jgi:DNA replication protein DnaC
MTTWNRLKEACKQLKLSQSVVENARKLNREATSELIEETNIEFLLKLLTMELEERDRKRRNSYLKSAKFEMLKTFENYTFEDIKFPNTLTPDNLMDATFVPKHSNIIMYGNVGAGKTHLAIATGIAACNAGFKTRFWRTASLVNALVEAKHNCRLSDFLKQFEKLDLLICDEWGYVPLDSEGTKLLYEVISQCCERKSIIITTNHEYPQWNEIFANTKITAALLDRIIYNSALVDFTNRDSRRLRAALMKQGVTDAV